MRQLYREVHKGAMDSSEGNRRVNMLHGLRASMEATTIDARLGELQEQVAMLLARDVTPSARPRLLNYR